MIPSGPGAETGADLTPASLNPRFNCSPLARLEKPPMTRSAACVMSLFSPLIFIAIGLLGEQAVFGSIEGGTHLLLSLSFCLGVIGRLWYAH